MRNKGFTLVELLLYSAVLATVGGLLTGVLTTSIRTQNIDNSTNEVTQQLDFVMSTVQRLVRDSSIIEIAYEGTATTTGCSQYCTLRLRMEDSADEPTIIRSDANGVYVKQGQAEEIPLTTNEITIDNLIFTKTEVAGGRATVQVDATFSRNTQNPRLATTRSLQSAISRVSAAVFDSNLIPNANNSFDLGQVSPNPTWKNLFLSNNLTVGNNLTVTGDSVISGDSTVSGDGTIMGNLGIGTASPSSNLEIYQTRDDADITMLTLTTAGTGAIGDKLNLLFRQPATGGALRNVAQISAIHNDPANNNGNLAFFTSISGVLTEQMRIDSSGSVGIGTTDPDTSAILDVSSSNKGFLPPRLTTAERDAIASPAAGLLVYNSDDNEHNAYDGSSWGAIAGGGGGLVYVPLTSPLTSSAWNYDVIVGDKTIDLQSVFGVPAGVKAVNVAVRFKDSAGSFVSLAPANTGNNVGAIFQGVEVSGRWVGMDGVVPTNSNGDIVWDSNSYSIDSVNMVIWGYWLPN